jgi:hypothetical protein
MSLKFPGKWRFDPPPDADFITSEIPEAAIDDFIEMVNKLAPQADRWDCQEPGYGDPLVAGHSDPGMFGYGDPLVFGLSDPSMFGSR